MRKHNTRRTLNYAGGRRPPNRGYKGGRHAHRRLIAIGLALIALLLALAFTASLISQTGSAEETGGEILVIPVDGIIDPRMSAFITKNIGKAEKSDARAVVLTLDTPGGLDRSMREIVKKVVNTPLPVIAYVYPSGARASSAGTFIMMAADVAAMAPGTNLGAALPVATGADPGSEEGQKIINDTAAYMRSLAEANGRNANWAELAVRQSISASADEALSQGVIDITAKNINSLLEEVNGYTTASKAVTIDTEGALISEAEMSIWDRLLHWILNPNIVYLLLLLGLLAIAYEFAHPGVGLGALTGFICLGLAIYALLVLPVNLAGLFLIILGFALLFADIYLASHGILSAAGVASLIGGSYLLFDSSASFLKVSLPLNIALALVTAAFFILIFRAAIKARGLPTQTGSEAMVGAAGTVKTRLDPLGQIHVHGEIWSARAPGSEIIEKGEEVVVTGVNRLVLRVKRKMD